MNPDSAVNKLEAASITDRGLSQKRPLNEDSMLVDRERGIFVVADGVGGAQAGEVASQTAVEVLDEAFRHHRKGDDVEDLLELAIQRANTSIHQMAQDHSKFSMMATTVVALHVDGFRATVGHVGDSRLYRLTPDGELHRETSDHTMLAEEVRAGRMTAEQAANHPSRNVISRALGAEASVEVDLKTFEVTAGTTFLLCSDGITGHVPDNEIRELLSSETDLEKLCAELKKRCYERGAEDNLTAVAVRIGERQGATSKTASQDATSELSDERTLLASRPPVNATPAIDIGPNAQKNSEPVLDTPTSDSSAASSDEIASRLESMYKAQTTSSSEDMMKESRGGTGKVLRSIGLLLLMALGVGAAFYGGQHYAKRNNQSQAPIESLGMTTPLAESRVETGFEQMRREVDQKPALALNRMEAETATQPSKKDDPQYLCLYGRALLLSGKPSEALPMYERAVARINEQAPPARDSIKIEALMGLMAAALRAGNMEAANEAAKAFEDCVQQSDSASTSPAPQ